MSEDFAALACYRHSQIKKRPSLGCDECAHLSRVVQEREAALTAERDRLRAAVEALQDRAECAFGSQDAARLHQDVYFMLDVAEKALAALPRREE